MGKARGAGGGRRPKSAALKLLAGNPGHRPITNGPAPGAPATSSRPSKGRAPPCPRFLTGEAKNAWNRLAPHLFAKGRLSPLDRDALCAYCLAWERYKKTQEDLRLTGDYLKVDGKVAINPLLWIAQAAEKQMARFMVEFGMTPSSDRKVGGGGSLSIETMPSQAADAYERAFGAGAVALRAKSAGDRGE
jgi:P27 family predicted phage terminase small subunit